MTKTGFGVVISLALGLGGATTATAAEIGWQPRLDFGFMNYSFEQDKASKVNSFGSQQEVGRISSVKFNADAAPFVGLGLTAFADQWFVDLYGLQSFSTSYDSFRFQETLTTTDTSSGNQLGTSVTQATGSGDFDRNEAALSLGYALSENAAVYAGYKWAQSEFDGKLTKWDTTSPDLKFRFAQKEELEYDGPFIGGTYVFHFPDLKAGLSLNAAVAWLDGTVTDKTRQVSPVATGTTKTSYDGDSLGLTLGVAWQGKTSVQGLGYSLGISGYQYNFDADSKQGEYRPDFTETNLIFKGGVSYQF